MIHLFLFVAGLVCLVVGANLLVRGASKLALSFGISPLVVGLTIVALGTSAPEIAVSVASVLGVSVRTLQGWEQGRKQPSGAARTLLAIARTNPKVVLAVSAQ